VYRLGRELGPLDEIARAGVDAEQWVVAAAAGLVEPDEVLSGADGDAARAFEEGSISSGRKNDSCAFWSGPMEMTSTTRASAIVRTPAIVSSRLGRPK